MLKPGQTLKSFHTKDDQICSIKVADDYESVQVKEFKDTFVAEDSTNPTFSLEQINEFLGECKKRLESKKYLLLYAWIGDIIVGECSLEKETGKKLEAETGISVRPGYRELGIGHELFTATINYGTKLISPKVAKLWVREFNAPAIGLYNKSGFKKMGFIPDACENPDGTKEGKILMERELT